MGRRCSSNLGLNPNISYVYVFFCKCESFKHHFTYREWSVWLSTSQKGCYRMEGAGLGGWVDIGVPSRLLCKVAPLGPTRSLVLPDSFFSPHQVHPPAGPRRVHPQPPGGSHFSFSPSLSIPRPCYPSPISTLTTLSSEQIQIYHAHKCRLTRQYLYIVYK